MNGVEGLSTGYIVGNLNVAAVALREEGYEIHGFGIGLAYDNRISSYEEDAEHAIDEFFDQLVEKEYFQATISTDSIHGAFQKGSQTGSETIADELLQQIGANIDVTLPELTGSDHALIYANVEYRPNTNGGYFLLESLRSDSEPYVNEFREILTEEGFETR